MNLFFIYIYKTISYQRADIRGTRSTGEKRRIAWPEMLIVLIPFYWAINIVTNALAYLRVLEGSCSHVLLTVQVNAFQWGWKYCYNDMFYTKYFTNNTKIGYQKNFSLNNTPKFIQRDRNWSLKNNDLLKDYKVLGTFKDGHFFKKTINIYTDLDTKIVTQNSENNYNPNLDISIENYFCRKWLKHFGNIENELNNKTLNKKWQNGYWITSQGLDASLLYTNELYVNGNENLTHLVCKDPLRLLRTSGALVLPTRNTIRLMSCSDDITHSWAVPSLGFKMDCVPGRIFCLYLNIIREGIYFGQCSELCGWNHYNMPVVVYGISMEHFIIWWEMELHSLFSKKHYKLNVNNFFEKELNNNILDSIKISKIDDNGTLEDNIVKNNITMDNIIDNNNI